MDEQTNQVSETNVTPNNEQRTYTEEEVKKERQSASSKAKFDVLSELGINSVDEFKNLRSELEKAKGEVENANKVNEENKNKYNELETRFNDYKKESVAQRLGVDKESYNDFKTLVESKVDSTHSFEEVAKEVADKYFKKDATPTMAVVTPTTPPVQKINTYGW